MSFLKVGKRPVSHGFSSLLTFLVVLFVLLLIPRLDAQAGTVSFDANGGSGTMDSVDLERGDALPACEFTRHGYIFHGWMTEPDGTAYEYEDQEEMDTDADMVLFALWEPQLYILHYDANGGFGTMEDQYVLYDEEVHLSDSLFSHRIFRFGGWVDSRGNRYEDGAAVRNLMSGNTFLSKVVTVDAGKPQDSSYRFRSTQGSVVWEEDGTTWLVTAASINDTDYYNGDLSHYETVLTKYDVSTGEAAVRVRNLAFDHGNGICRNPDTGHLFIAEGGSTSDYPSGVMELDADLNFVKEWTFPLLTNIWAISYTDHHFYVIGKNDEGEKIFCELNESMQTLNYTQVDEYYSQNFSSQGIASDGSFIYAVSAGFKAYEWKSKQRINVFTHDGTYIGAWTVDIPYEAEDITVIGPYAYITTNEGAKSTLYRMRLPSVTLHAVWEK